MTDEIPCNSGKSLLLQGILLLTHTGMESEKEPQVTVSKSIRNSGFRALMSRWKATPFGELVHEFSDRTKEEDEDTLLSAAIEGMFLNTELFGHQRGASNKGYKKIKYGTMVLSTQNLHLGNANVNQRFEHGMVSPAYKTYEITGCSVDLMAQWIKSEAAKRFFYNATTVGASVCRRDALQRISAFALAFSVALISSFSLTADGFLTVNAILSSGFAPQSATAEMTFASCLLSKSKASFRR